MNKFDRKERHEFESSRRDSTHNWSQPARVPFIYNYSVNTDKHCTTQNTSKVLRISDLVQKEIKFALGDLIWSQIWIRMRNKITYSPHISVSDFRCMQNDILMGSSGRKFCHFCSMQKLCLNLVLFGQFCNLGNPRILTASSISWTSKISITSCHVRLLCYIEVNFLMFSLLGRQSRIYTVDSVQVLSFLTLFGCISFSLAKILLLSFLLILTTEIHLVTSKVECAGRFEI